MRNRLDEIIQRINLSIDAKSNPGRLHRHVGPVLLHLELDQGALLFLRRPIRPRAIPANHLDIAAGAAGRLDRPLAGLPG